jgi:hypothetical protein
VLLIWLYEKSKLVPRRTHPSAKFSPTTMTRPLWAGYVTADLNGKMRLGPTPSTALKSASRLDDEFPARNQSAAEGPVDLINLVQKLSAQVDALTAMVAGQQKD